MGTNHTNPEQDGRGTFVTRWTSSIQSTESKVGNLFPKPHQYKTKWKRSHNHSRHTMQTNSTSTFSFHHGWSPTRVNIFCMTNDLRDFWDKPWHKWYIHLHIYGIHGMVIEDDTGRIHKIQIPNTAYSVGNSSKLLSPQYWSLETKDRHLIL